MASAGSDAVKTVLGFDFGTRLIGTAIGQTLTATATPLRGIKAVDGIPDWRDIEDLLMEWKPDCLVVGLPLNMDGSDSEMTVRARKFGNRLHGRFGLNVFFSDERLSSFIAKDELMARQGAKARDDFKASGVDSVAAKVILETWLAQHRAKPATAPNT